MSSSGRKKEKKTKKASKRGDVISRRKALLHNLDAAEAAKAVPERAASSLPEHLEEQRTRVRLHRDAPIPALSTAADTFKSVGFDNSFSLEKLRQGLHVSIVQNTSAAAVCLKCRHEAPRGTLECPKCNSATSDRDAELVFDLVGIDAPIANAFRRILLAEVPTMAIEWVYMQDNTSVVPDEVLAHRLGLVPILADPAKFSYRTSMKHPTDTDTLMFKLDVTCTQDAHHIVTSKDLVWEPSTEDQAALNPHPRPVHGDIVLAKLRPGQRLQATCHAVKGTGKEHAKWSPVATAYYRLLPEVKIVEEVTGADAEELVGMCPVNVFDIEDLGNGKKRAVVARPRNCTVCRGCIRSSPWDERIKLARVNDHFVFSIESTGAMDPAVIFRRAIKVFQEKCDMVQAELNRLRGTDGSESDTSMNE